MKGMASNPWKALKVCGLLLVLLFLCAQTSGAGPARTEKGYILEVFEDGSFRLDNNALVQLSPKTKVLRDGVPYAGPLLVGLEVRAKGNLTPDESQLQARQIEVLTDVEGEAKGTAVLEAREETPEGTLLYADGRKLLITPRTRLLPGENQKADRRAETVSEPGQFLRYRGRWTETGMVIVDELWSWRNCLEEKEKSIYEKYQPVMLVPKSASSGEQVLKIHKNRYSVLNSNDIQQYADRLGMRLLPAFSQGATVAERLGYSFWFIVAEHERPQASAFPSGVVVIHSELLRLAENEAQLAFALAHEIAHVTQEHAWREYEYHRGKLLLLRWGTAGLGYVVESAIRRGYQRDLEEQADRLALWYMSQAGYDPREGLQFLRRLEARQEGLRTLLWDTHRSYGQRRKALMRELARLSQAGLTYAGLTRNTGEFSSLQAGMPTAEIDKVETVQ